MANETATRGLNAMAPEIAARLIFESFKKPSRVATRTADQPLMARAVRLPLTVNDQPVMVYQWGRGDRTVVCIHGWSARASDFCAFVDPLVEVGYRVVAFDNPGHGESGGDTTTLLDVRLILLALQKRMGPPDVVMGHSLGALYAFYALNHGVSASCLITLSGVCNFSYLITRYVTSMNLREETVDLLKRHLESMFGRPTIWEEFSAHNNLSGLQARVCLIHDAEDDFVELSQSEKLKAALGGRAVLHVTRGLGHRRILTEPAVIGHILDEIGRTDVCRSGLEQDSMSERSGTVAKGLEI